jgi:hypothetical protein
MKNKYFLTVKLLALIISILLIDGGRTFILVGNNLHSIISHHQDRDLASPIHNCFSLANDDEKWLETENIDITSQDNPVTYFHLPEFFRPQFYPGSVWQPPKSA